MNPANSHASLLARLLPPESYAPNAPHLRAELFAEGRALDRIDAQAIIVRDAVTPLHTVDFLADWERICGLAPEAGTSYAARLDAVIAKLREVGGLSIAYFVALAARLGYVVSISEVAAFYVDLSCVDADALHEADAHWVWHVHIEGSATRSYPFHVDSSCVDEPLLGFADPMIEAVFNDLKPAHTFATFDYEDTSP